MASRVYLALAAIILFVGCSLDPPPGKGVFAYTGDGPVRLARMPGKSVQRKLLSKKILDKVVRVPSIKALVAKSGRDNAKLKVFWKGAGDKKHPGKTEPLDKDPQAMWLMFDEEPAQGWVLLRVKGPGIGGWYPLVIGDSFDWAMSEGRSWFRLKNWTKAEEAFRRAVDQDDKAEALRMLSATLIRLKKNKEALKVADKAWDKAKDAEMELVSFGSLLGEAHMMNGDYEKGLDVFDQLKLKYPTDKRWQKELGRLLEGVDPSPAKLVRQVYTAAMREGVDGIEPFVMQRDVEEKGEASLKAFARNLVKFGRVKRVTPRQTQRFGRVAFVKYQVRFGDGTKLDRKMTFYLDDAGHYKIRLD